MRDHYAFAAHSETAPYLALGRLRGKIHEGLATQHLAAGSRSHVWGMASRSATSPMVAWLSMGDI